MSFLKEQIFNMYQRNSYLYMWRNEDPNKELYPIWLWNTERLVQTLGLLNQLAGLNVERRLNKSPLSQGLQEGCDDPSVEPPALMLNDVYMGCVPMRWRDTPFELCPWPNQSVLPAFMGTAGDDAPAELFKTDMDINSWCNKILLQLLPESKHHRVVTY